MKIFVSYATEDFDVAQKIAAALRSRGPDVIEPSALEKAAFIDLDYTY